MSSINVDYNGSYFDFSVQEWIDIKGRGQVIKIINKATKEPTAIVIDDTSGLFYELKLKYLKAVWRE